MSIETNLANAQLSTGPRAPDGKQRSALNALRHGLTGQLVVMPTEDLEAYRRHLASFTGDLHPKGPIESPLVASKPTSSPWPPPANPTPAPTPPTRSSKPWPSPPRSKPTPRPSPT